MRNNARLHCRCYQPNLSMHPALQCKQCTMLCLRSEFTWSQTPSKLHKMDSHRFWLQPPTKSNSICLMMCWCAMSTSMIWIVNVILGDLQHVAKMSEHLSIKRHCTNIHKRNLGSTCTLPASSLHCCYTINSYQFHRSWHLNDSISCPKSTATWTWAVRPHAVCTIAVQFLANLAIHNMEVWRMLQYLHDPWCSCDEGD